MVLSFFFFILNFFISFLGWYPGLNSELCDFEAGTLLLEPHFQS
jgi:hypothetical protein